MEMLSVSRCYHRPHVMSVLPQAHLVHESDIAGLPDAGGMMQWLIDRELGAQHLRAYRLSVDSDSAGTHAHPGADEVLYIVSGSGEIRVEQSSHLVRPGLVVFVPEGAEHRYINTGREPFIVVGAMAQAIASTRAGDTVGSALIDERRVAPRLMGERSFRVLAGPEIGCRGMTQFTGVIPTGRAELHAHPHEEAVYILAGSGRLWIDDQVVGSLRPGSAVFFPIGIRHTLENSGPSEMRVLGVFSPAGSPEAKLAASG